VSKRIFASPQHELSYVLRTTAGYNKGVNDTSLVSAELELSDLGRADDFDYL
jgi:hypothetical protein